MADYLDINRASWDERAPAHAASRLTDRPWRLAHSYTLQAVKR